MNRTRDDAEDSGASVSDRMRASALKDDVSFLLARANALSLSAGHAALAPFNLRVRSYSILALVVDDIRPSQRDIAEHLRLDPSQVVSLIDDLQARGLVKRDPDPLDRRTNVVVMTDEGRELFRSAHDAVRAAERDLHAHLSPDQRERLSELLLLVAFPD